MSTDLFPQGAPTGADNGPNELEGHDFDQERIDAYPKPGKTLLGLGHALDVIAAADTYGRRRGS